MSEQAQVQTVTRDLGVGGEVVSGLQQHLRPENVDWGLVVAIFSVTVQPLMGRGSWRHGLHCESMEVILPGQVREVRWADGSRRCDFPCAGGLLYHGGSWADSFWGTKWVGEQGRNRWAHMGLIVWSICWVLQLGGRKLHRRKREGPRSPHSSCPPAHHAAAGRQQDNIFTWLGTDCQMLLHGLKFSGRFGLKWSSIPFTIYICYGCFFFPFVVRLWLSMYFHEKSLILIIVPLVKEVRGWQWNVLIYCAHIYMHPILFWMDHSRHVRGPTQRQIPSQKIHLNNKAHAAKPPCPDSWVIGNSSHPIALDTCRWDSSVHIHLSSFSSHALWDVSELQLCHFA